MLWNIEKGKRKGYFFSFRFWPSSAEPSKAPHLPSPARGPSPLPLLSALGRAAASPASRLARKRARRALPSSLSLADATGPRVGRLLPPHVGRIPFLVHHRPNPRFNLPPSFLGTAFGLYKSHAEPNRNHLVLFAVDVVLESSVTASGSPSRCLSEPRNFLGSPSASILP
jgi:hypothetical protein